MAYRSGRKSDKRRQISHYPDPAPAYRSYGSLAYAPEEVPLEEERPQPRPRHAHRPRSTGHWRSRLHLFFLVGIVFAGGISVAASYAILKQEQVKLTQLQDELAVLQSSNLSLEAEITEKVNLDYVEQEAKGRLGMSEPKAYQIIYIDVPQESGTTQYAEAEPEEAPSFSIASMIGNLFSGTDEINE